MPKEVPFVEMQAGAKVDKPELDGNYAVISHNPGPVGPLRLPNALPWMERIYTFKGGLCDDVGCSSDVGSMILSYEVAKVYLVGLGATLRPELNKLLAKHDIKLVPETVDA